MAAHEALVDRLRLDQRRRQVDALDFLRRPHRLDEPLGVQPAAANLDDAKLGHLLKEHSARLPEFLEDARRQPWRRHVAQIRLWYDARDVQRPPLREPFPEHAPARLRGRAEQTDAGEVPLEEEFCDEEEELVGQGSEGGLGEGFLHVRKIERLAAA